jgi:hypothetical protein
MKRHYYNTYKDFTYNDFTYNIKKCDITCMLLFTVISKFIYNLRFVTSNAIRNVIISKVFISIVVVSTKSPKKLVFVPGNPLRPSLIFLSKARTCPSGAPFRCPL